MQGRHTQEDGGFDRNDDTVTVSNRHKGLDRVLLKDFSALPKHVDYGDYAVINVAPSVVPAYFPSFRIFNYNISTEAVEEALERKERRHLEASFKHPPPHGHRKPDPRKSRDKQCKKDKYKDSWRCHFSKDNWHSDPEAPSRKNGLMTPLGYAQVSLEPFDSFGGDGVFRLACVTSREIPSGSGAHVYHSFSPLAGCPFDCHTCSDALFHDPPFLPSPFPGVCCSLR